MSVSSRANESIKYFLNQYKKLVQRSGNGLKISKFHQMLHITRNICRHGSASNFDGSRPEAIAKDLAKSPGMRTQKRHKTINYDTAIRYHQDVTILEAERLFNNKLNCSSYRKMKSDKKKPYSYFSQVNKNVGNQYCDKDFSFNGSSYHLSVEVFDHPIKKIQTITSNVIHSKIDGIKARIDDELLICVTNWLWIDPIGGTIDMQSKPKFYTEMRMNNETYHCHPKYRSESSKYDWVYLDWGEGYDEPLPARLHMLIDISECNVIRESESYYSQLQSEVSSDYDLLTKMDLTDHDNATNYLSSTNYWAVIHSVDNDGYIDNDNYPSLHHMKSSICKKARMEKGRYRIVPITDIIRRAMCIVNMVQFAKETNHVYDHIVTVIEHPSKWENYFLTLND